MDLANLVHASFLVPSLPKTTHHFRPGQLLVAV
jgi:hypothetical protein